MGPTPITRSIFRTPEKGLRVKTFPLLCGALAAAFALLPAAADEPAPAAPDPAAAEEGADPEEAFHRLFAELEEKFEAGDLDGVAAGLKAALEDPAYAANAERLFSIYLGFLLQTGRIDEAKAAYLGALRTAPERAEPCSGYIYGYLLETGDRAGALDWARERGTRLHVHMSETKSEVEQCRERHGGLSPVQWFESLGAFDVPVIAAHCVWIDDADIAILADHGATVVHNPASNLKLSSGFAPIAKMIDAGVNVALGTDGMASNNNHDMFQDMYLMAMLPKGKELDPTLITPRQAVFAATRAGALAQGREDCGLVKEGFKADLCVLDVTGISWCPVNDMLTNVVYAGHGSDVVLTMCDGAVVYRDGVWPTLDIDRVKAEVCERTVRIQDELAQG